MTATKTRPPKTDPFSKLRELDAAYEKAALAASELGTEHGKELREHQALTDERRRLTHREPGLVDHLGQPLDSIEDNPVREIDKAISDLGDLSDLTARRDHARKLAERKRQDVQVHVAEHYLELVEAFRPDAEAARDAVTAKVEELRAVVEDYIATAQRSVGLTASVQGVDGRFVPGINEAANLKRAITDVQLPVPVPGPERLA